MRGSLQSRRDIHEGAAAVRRVAMIALAADRIDGGPPEQRTGRNNAGHNFGIHYLGTVRLTSL